MTGTYKHSLDSKGRVFVPAKLREELGDIFYITISGESYLCAYSAENWNFISSRIAAMPYSKQKKMRPMFAYAARCETDPQGRILIPQNLRNYAGMEKAVTVIGCNNHAELWASESWDSSFETGAWSQNFAEALEELEF